MSFLIAQVASEAYERLRQLYDKGEAERLPTLIARLKFLEEKLNTSPDQRIQGER